MTEAIVVLLLSPLLFLGVAEWQDWQKECERTLHRAKNAGENGRMLQGDKSKQMRSFKIERPQNAVCVLLYDRTQIRQRKTWDAEAGMN